MKPFKTFLPSCRWFGASLSLVAALAANATDVTFQVDMTSQPSASTVLIKGSFNGWGSPTDSLALTNDGNGIYSQTITISDAPGTLENCKFFYSPGDNWEGGNNRQFVLGSGTQVQVLPLTAWNANDWPTPSNPEEVTFQVDLSAQVLGGTFTPGQTVTVAGDFEGWDNGLNLTNNPDAAGLASNIYSGTFDFSVTAYPPVYINYKFRANGGWESPSSTSGGNRYVNLTNNPQVLPVVYYEDLAPNAPTNQVTFQVDMTPQTLTGAFAPGQSVTVSGGFEGWDNGLPLTNNPTLSGNASNIYSAICPVVGYRPVGIAYKFRANGGWESPNSTGGNNRTANVTNANQVLSLVFYNDNSPYDIVQADTLVQFTLYLPDGTSDKDGLTFAKGVDSIYLNGDFLGWWGWGAGSAPAANQMVEVGTSDLYTNSFLIPRGNSIYLTYKYSFDGLDDEGGFGTNHVREIRTYAPTYNLPLDQWSFTLAQNPGNHILTPGTNGIVELDFGYLSASTPAAGKIPVTWWGRPGVVLQNNSSLTGGSWNDNNASDATMSTNWPNAGGSQFFRLKKK